ncbi:uncharacterized protein LOC133844901 isoform X1 [Drosophila sulfurigaster albostrigata]|uniref:uncharacterized protein LOC133844901 isoform X1 n=1 Tax=Drosophila sulfurigaster albostrigata TaxID=89887 RepID=UPI002D21AED4|nr:uncharacterized protein LOC133844901 isoform X1 [Drosophila sulfurigaster albostrigata]
MSNSGMPRAASNDDNAMELQQLILRSYKSMNGLVNFYNGQLHDELEDLMLSIQQEDQRQTRCTSDHSSQLTEALDLKCLAGINKLSQYLMMRPSCSSLDLSDGPKFREL